MSDLAAQSAPLHPDQTADRRPARRFMGLRMIDLTMIMSVIAVVCVVTLPRLADYVRHTNEADARTALALLGPICFPAGAETPVGSLAELSGASHGLRHRLRDARLVQGEARLLYHGYLFELQAVEGSAVWLVANPRRADTTGEDSYAWSPGRGLMRATPAGTWTAAVSGD